MKSNLFEDGKNRRMFGGWPIDGVPIKTLSGMIYWYGWGDDEDFDIRIVRRVLGLPEEQPKIDKWFMAKRPNQCKAYGAMCRQLSEALASTGRSFADVLAEHDAIIDRQSNMFLDIFRDESLEASSLSAAAPKSTVSMGIRILSDSELDAPF